MPSAVTVRSDDPAELARRELLMLEPCGDANKPTAHLSTRSWARQRSRRLQIPSKASRLEGIQPSAEIPSARSGRLL